MTRGGATSARVLELPRCSLVFLSGPRRGEERRIEGDVFRIGKSPDSDLVLTDETVSRVHCEIVRETKGFLLRDLGSTNGTLLDGAEIREVWLKPGAVITVGQVELKVRPWSERIELAPSAAERFGDVVGRSIPMRRVFGLLERVAAERFSVLLVGEPGTGKSAIAAALHRSASRSAGPLVVVDCSVSDVGRLERELLGSVDAPGALVRAQGGTLVLDEVVELPLDLQPKLLRALGQRVGREAGDRDVRLVGTSRRDPSAEVARGKFRSELLARLAQVRVELPPLRERLEDVPLLVETLLEQVAASGQAAHPPSPHMLEGLSEHDWPGNVRELRDVLLRTMRATPSAQPGLASLLAEFDPSRSYRDTRAEWEAHFERAYVAWLLDRHGANISAAARAADMDRKYLYRLAKKHELHPARAHDEDVLSVESRRRER